MTSDPETTMTITTDQLCAAMPAFPRAMADAYTAPLNAALDEWDITTPARIAAFLAQIAHESEDMNWWTELASGDEYEGRADLGNTQPGDGPRYKGRGPIQLTGRANYRAASTALNASRGATETLDMEAYPELAATPTVGFRVAGWYWSSHGLNGRADAAGFDEPPATDQLDAFRAITHQINGGYSGEGRREACWRRAKTALGVVPGALE